MDENANMTVVILKLVYVLQKHSVPLHHRSREKEPSIRRIPLLMQHSVSPMSLPLQGIVQKVEKERLIQCDCFRIREEGRKATEYCLR